MNGGRGWFPEQRRLAMVARFTPRWVSDDEPTSVAQVSIFTTFGAFERWQFVDGISSGKGYGSRRNMRNLEESLLFLLKEDGEDSVQRWKRIGGKDLGPKGCERIIESQKKLEHPFVLSSLL
ncbi:hypothetical protein F2P56_027403 [Juglans regia]|uniref:Uncharacterized protein n=1 Tax=Juglans regia TaxID=51240 RepID=A0A833TUI5_JUGRE|nr:hypothetical protein F2P56_027403 [Juglans regia]